MARPREPVDLILAKGKKHFTKEEIEERKKSEIKAPNDAVAPPSFLTKAQQQEFTEIANNLIKIGIMSNLDCDVLGRYLVSKDLYLKTTRALKSCLSKKDYVMIDSVAKLQDRYFKQCQTCASSLGLTISSRCKLIAPQIADKEPKKNKFTEFKKE